MIEQAIASADMSILETISHQLKGSGAGYGYPTITATAADLEDAVKASPDSVDALKGEVDELINMCKRAMAGFEGA